MKTTNASVLILAILFAYSSKGQPDNLTIHVNGTITKVKKVTIIKMNPPTTSPWSPAKFTRNELDSQKPQLYGPNLEIQLDSSVSVGKPVFIELPQISCVMESGHQNTPDQTDSRIHFADNDGNIFSSDPLGFTTNHGEPYGTVVKNSIVITATVLTGYIVKLNLWNDYITLTNDRSGNKTIILDVNIPYPINVYQRY